MIEEENLSDYFKKSIKFNRDLKKTENYIEQRKLIEKVEGTYIPKNY